MEERRSFVGSRSRTLRRVMSLGKQLLPFEANSTASSTAATLVDRDDRDRRSLPLSTGSAAFSCVPLTPHTGAEIFGFDFEALPHDPSLLRQLDEAFLKYKVLMFREAGLGGPSGTSKGSQTQLRFLGFLANHWGLDVPQNEQQRQIRGPNGLLVHPMLPHVRYTP